MSIISPFIYEFKPPKTHLKVHKFIIAESLKHAVSSAVVDWGWDQIGEASFKMTSGWRADGDIVRYLSCYEQIHGLYHVTLYLGYGYFRHPDWESRIYSAACYQGFRMLKGP